MVTKICSEDMSKVSTLSISRNLSERSEFAKTAAKQETEGGEIYNSALAAVELTGLDVKTGSDVEFDISEIDAVRNGSIYFNNERRRTAFTENDARKSDRTSTLGIESFGRHITFPVIFTAVQYSDNDTDM